MKQPRAILYALLCAVLLLASCGSTVPSNDPAVAAGVLSQAGQSVQAAATPKALAKAVKVDIGSSSGSVYAGDFTGSGITTIAITFTGEPVIYNGDTYTIDGTMEYAFKDTTVGSAMSFSALVYTKGITISGPDYEGTFNADFKEDVSMTFDGTTYTIKMKVEGTVAGQSINQTITTSFTSPGPV